MPEIDPSVRRPKWLALTWHAIIGATLVGAPTLYGCGAETTEPTTAEPTQPAVASIVVMPAGDTLLSLGDTVQLTASARDANGNTIPDKTFAWSSSDDSVATINSSGLVTAAGANGLITITAATDGIAGTATVDVVTGPQGGTVSVANGQVKLVFPAGSVDRPIVVTVDVGSLAPSSTRLVPGTVFDFGPSGTQFNVPVRLTIGYDPSDLPVESLLRLFQAVGDRWVEVSGSGVDVVTKTVTGEITTFSRYAVLSLTTACRKQSFQCPPQEEEEPEAPT